MSTISIRKVQGNDIADAFELSFYAFCPTPGPKEEHNKRLAFYRDYTGFVTYENQTPVSSLVCRSLQQNVRGTMKPMCGVGDVATIPHARRKGYAKQLLAKAFQYMKESGLAFSTLYPFKESFYGKVGYITFPQLRTAIFSPQSLESLLQTPLSGTVQRTTLTEGFETYLQFLEQMRKHTHGFSILARPELEYFRDKTPLWLVTAINNNEVIGMATYRITGYQKELRIRDFYYSTSLGKFLLLQWFAKHVDQVRQVFLPIRPNEYPETWAPDFVWGENGQVKTWDWISPMGRVVIVEDLSGITVGSGEVKLKIRDDDCPWNNRSFSFSAEKGILQVSPTKNYECEITIQGLSAIIYGGHLLEDFPYRGWGTLSREMNTRITALFPPKLPYLHADL